MAEQRVAPHGGWRGRMRASSLQRSSTKCALLSVGGPAVNASISRHPMESSPDVRCSERSRPFIVQDGELEVAFELRSITPGAVGTGAQVIVRYCGGLSAMDLRSIGTGAPGRGVFDLTS